MEKEIIGWEISAEEIIAEAFRQGPKRDLKSGFLNVVQKKNKI